MRYVALLVAAGLAGCAQITMNDGDRVAVRYPADSVSQKAVLAKATQACVENGKQSATLLRDVVMSPEWGPMSDNVATFACR